MPKISNSDECRKAYGSLSFTQQRRLGARLVANVLDLTDDYYSLVQRFHLLTR